MIIGNGGPIAVVDDDRLDLAFFRRSYKRRGIANPLLVFPSGEAFLEYLEAVERDEEPDPTLALLDINMPGLSGFDVLDQTRARPRFRKLPIVVMLTNSDDPRDERRALELGANGFALKESAFDDFQSFIDELTGILSR